MSSRLLGALAFALAGCSLFATATEVGMVTGLAGQVEITAPTLASAAALQAFVKLRAGDRLVLADDAHLQLVFFAGGREEVWRGPGTLQLADEASVVLTGGLQPQVRQLPRLLVKQLAKTPSPDGQVKAGMLRMRSMPTGGTVESVEQHYAELRQAASADDRTPDLYLLAGYFELQQFAKLQQRLQQMNRQAPQDSELKLLSALYARAIKNAQTVAP